MLDEPEPKTALSNRTLLRVIFGLAAAVLVLMAVVAYAFVRVDEAAHSQAVIQKASTKTRVSTVSQRCDLTNLMLTGFIPRGPWVTAKLTKSLAGCRKQLATVKAINANTPEP